MTDTNQFKLAGNYIYFILSSIGKAYPILLPFITTMYSLLSENTLGFIFAGLSILTTILNLGLKWISKQIYLKYDSLKDGKCNSFWTRPSSISNKGSIIGTSTGCGSFENCTKYKNISFPSAFDIEDCIEILGIGMPSGHAQISTAMTFLLIMHIWNNNKSFYYQITTTIFIIILALGVMWDRIIIKCHTFTQVLIGSFIGYLSGIGYYYFLNWLYPDQFAKIDKLYKHLIIWIYPVLIMIVFIINLFI